MKKLLKMAGTGAVAIVFGLMLVWIGIRIGLLQAAAKPAAAPAATVTVTVGCPKTAEAVARRNVVWNFWNGKPDDASPDAKLAAALTIIIRPELPPEVRNVGLTSYLGKSALYFSEKEIEGLAEHLANGPQDKRMEAFGRIAAVDLGAAQLVSCVLADTERVNLFIAGKPVPLEEPEASPAK